MRGDDQRSGHLFSYLSPEQRVPADHPLRAIRQMTALVMELVEGADLSQRIARGAIPLDEALLLAQQMAEALEAAAIVSWSSPWARSLE